MPLRNYSIVDRENEQLRKENADLRALPMRKEFAQNLLESLGTILANKPYADWPHEAKAAMQHMKRKAPTAAEDYLSRLPQD